MATLEKIRSKSVLLFTVIIVALLAFIMGDFLTSGRSFFGPGDTVAKVNGAKVDYRTYQERLNTAIEEQKNNGREIDNDVLSQQVIDQMLVEALLDQEYDRMGITVTNKQLGELMLGETTGPQVFQSLLQKFGQQGAQALYQKGIVDVRNYYDAMNSPKKYGIQPEEAKVLKQVWSELETNIDKGLRQQAYGALLDGLFTANAIDAKEMYAERNTTTHFAYVRKDFTSIPDDKIKLTDDDYQKVYDEHKGAFKINEEQRAVNYIMVPVVPSEADYAAGQSEVETVIAELNATEGTEALAKHQEFMSQTGKFTKAGMAKDQNLRLLAIDSMGLAKGLVRPLQTVAGNYVIAKVLDVTSGIDRVKFSVIAGPAAQVDSLTKTLTVANFDSIARLNGGAAGIELSLINPNMQLDEAQKIALAERPVGQIFTLNDTVNMPDEQGKTVPQAVAQAFLITERDLALPAYEVATITYKVVPSTQTVNDLNAKFHAYVANNANTEAFVDNAVKAGYQVGDAVVSASTPLVGNAPSSRGAVKWAMDNKKGKVSPVFSKTGANDYLLAVAVADVYDGKYIPVTSKLVRDQLKGQAINNKKAAQLINQYAGKAKEMNGYASLMGTPVAQADAVFAEDQVPGVGYFEQDLQGQVAGSAKGKVVGPFQGNNAVYVISVTGADQQGRPYEYAENAQNFAQKFTRALMQNPLQLLAGDKEVKNNILEFTAEEVN